MISRVTDVLVDVLSGVTSLPRIVEDGPITIEIDSVQILNETQGTDNIMLDAILAQKKRVVSETLIKHGNFLIVVKGGGF